MVKFDHTKESILEAVGLSENDISKENVNKAVKNALLPNSVLTDTDRLVLLLVVGSANPLLEPVLSGLTGIEFSTQSELIEYMYKYLNDKGYAHIAIKMLKGATKDD